MGRKEAMAEKVHELMYKTDHIRNIGIIAHIDHGKTTLSDNLIAGAGLMSQDLSGKACVLDFYELEAQRGITIFASNVSMVYEYEGDHFLVNLIDTPGHVDFGGNVTRAMRAVDGAVAVACAVEGVMPQTETVLKQALKEKVRPVLYINKVDRLINELQVTPEELQVRLTKIITKVNSLIQKYAPEEYKQKWQVSVADGTVAFGSAYHNWAISAPYMKRTGITFKDIIQACKEEKQKELAVKIPGFKVLLDMVIMHHPSPMEAQKYRIPNIWQGDQSSQFAQDMLNCNAKGKVAMMVTGIATDPHAGEIAKVRVYSGTVKKGDKVFLINTGKEAVVQQVAIYMIDGRVQIDDVPAGNIAAITGLKDAYAGETAAEEKIEPFEAIKHNSEPVMTKSVEAKNPKDLPKLIEALRQVGKEDPTVKVQINEETGEHLISGMGELHLEIVEHIISKDKNVPIETSQPIVVYRENVNATSPEVEGKSPNRHNKFYINVEPLSEGIYQAIIDGELKEGKVKDSKLIVEKLVSLGMDRDEAKKVWYIYGGNMLVDVTKGNQYIQEVKELAVQGFMEAMDGGPLAREKCNRVLIKIHDATLHEDAVHRGPSQIIPAFKKAILGAMLMADPILLEPKQKLLITAPQDYMGAVTNDVQGRRGRILEITQEEDSLALSAKVPVAEMFGFAAGIRSATQGRAMWNLEYAGYEQLPKSLQNEVVRKIRERKGLPADIPTPATYLDD